MDSFQYAGIYGRNYYVCHSVKKWLLNTPEIAETANISKERTTYRLNNELAQKKLSARKRLLSVDPKLVRIQNF